MNLETTFKAMRAAIIYDSRNFNELGNYITKPEAYPSTTVEISMNLETRVMGG